MLFLWHKNSKDNYSKYFGKDFKNIKNKMYLDYPNGFYVNNKLENDGYKFNSLEDLIRYVTRYCARPAMAESKIINYDGENVTFFYTDHKNEEYHEETNSAFEFITKLLQHLLPYIFKSIRNYDFYSKNSHLYNKMIKIISNEKAKAKRQLINWTNSILLSFNCIPIMYPKWIIYLKFLEEVFIMSNNFSNQNQKKSK